MKNIKFLIAAMAIFTFFSCQNNNSSENDEKNDKEVVENNSDNEEISKQRTDEEQIQFIKDEFAKIEGNENLTVKEFTHSEPAASHELKKFYNQSGELVKINFYSAAQTIFSEATDMFYFKNNKLIFVIKKTYFSSGAAEKTTEDRYYIKNEEVIKHIATTTDKNFETNKEDNDTKTSENTSPETTNEIIKDADNYKKIESDNEFAKLF